jgi:uncharacterized coiled-coil protein SlyX
MFRRGGSRIIVRMDAGAADDYNVLCAEIQTLLEPPVARQGQSLQRLEDTLTEGYARALALEAERWRLERRIGELGAGVGSDERSGDEIATLAARLAHASSRLDGLRALLGALRQRADAVRTLQIA